MRSNQSSILNNSLDQRYNNSHNSYLKTEMDKPKSILTNRKTDSSRGNLLIAYYLFIYFLLITFFISLDHLISDLRHGYSTTFLDGFSYNDREEEVERV